MKRLVLPACAALPALAACALPSRDNKYDPSNAPTVRARVIDYTDAGGACMLLDDTRLFPVVAIAPRGHCLAIDARDSTDPQGTPREDLVFEFALLATDGEHAIAAQGAFGPLDLSTRARLAIDELSYFRVRVVDPDGSTGVADVPFVALNMRPRAATLPPRREIPLHGFPWSGIDQPFLATFSAAASVDPDGDPLAATWTLDGETYTDDLLGVAVATDHVNRRVASLVVSDLSETSGAVTGTVTVEVPRPWVLSGQTDKYLQRVDIEPRAIQFSPPLPAVFDAVRVLPGEPDALVVGHTSGIFEIGPYPTEAPLLAPHVPRPFLQYPGPGGTAYPGLAFDRSRRTLWLVARQSLGTGRIASLLVATAGGLSYTDGIEVILPGLEPYYEVHDAEVDPDGNVWTATLQEDYGVPRILALRPADQAIDSIEMGEIGIIPRIEARPGTAEMWVRGTEPLDAHVFRFEGLPSAGYTPLSVPGSFVGPKWVDAQRAWAWTGEHGLALVDMDVFAAGFPYDESIVLACPEVLSVDAESFFVDDVTGTAWLYDSTAPASLYRATTDGTLVRWDIGYSTLAGVDPYGVPLLLEASGADLVLRRTDTPVEANGVATSTRVPGVVSAHRDPRTGGVWANRVLPGSSYLYWIGPDGTDLARVTELGGEPLPRLVHMRLSHDGLRGWAFVIDETSSVIGAAMLSFDDGLTEVRSVLGTTDATDLLYKSEVGLVPTRSSYAWGVRWDAANARLRVQTVTSAGLRSDVHALPVGEGDNYSSYSSWGDVWSDDSLCLAVAVYPTEFQVSSLHMFRVTASTLTDLGYVPVSPVGGIPDVYVTTTEDGGNQRCWVATGQSGMTGYGSVVFSIDATGTVTHSLTLSNERVTTMAPLGEHEVLFGELTPGPGVVRSDVHRVSFVPGMVTATSAHAVFTIDGQGQGPTFIGR